MDKNKFIFYFYNEYNIVFYFLKRTRKNQFILLTLFIFY